MGLLQNIDSRINIDRETALCAVAGSWVGSLVGEIPIYAVSKETMDLIAPPERLKGIDEESLKACIRKAMGLAEASERRSREQSRSMSISSLLECLKANSKEFRSIALGVFVAPKDANPRSFSLLRDIRLPAIFLCPERISTLADTIAGHLGLPYDDVFAAALRAVVSHERGHALAWKLSGGASTEFYKSLPGRILEELVAQVVAYSDEPPMTCKGYILYRLAIDEKSSRQPIEYRLYKLLSPAAAASAYARLLTEAYAAIATIAVRGDTPQGPAKKMRQSTLMKYINVESSPSASISILRLLELRTGIAAEDIPALLHGKVYDALAAFTLHASVDAVEALAYAYNRLKAVISSDERLLDAISESALQAKSVADALNTAAATLALAYYLLHSSGLSSSPGS